MGGRMKTTHISRAWCSALCGFVFAAQPAWVLLILTVGTSPGLAVQFENWEHSARITFTGYGQSETLTDIPLLVELSTNVQGFSYSQFAAPATGGDLRFTDISGTQELKFEIDYWDPASNSYAWVRVPSLSGTTTAILAWWGNPGATNLPAYCSNGSVWTNGYVGVWHMTSTNALDSTAYKNHAVPAGDLGERIDTDAAGCLSVGRSVEFRGPNLPAGSLTVGNSASPLDGHTRMTFTVRYHRFTTGNGDQGHLFSKLADATPPEQYAYRLHHLADKKYHFEFNPPASTSGESAGESSKQVWEHVALIYDGVTSNAFLYVNGALECVTNGFGSAVGSSPYDLIIGNTPLDTDALEGIVDEFRVESVARSTNWVWATWMNMASNSAFATYAPVESRMRCTLFSFR